MTLSRPSAAPHVQPGSLVWTHQAFPDKFEDLETRIFGPGCALKDIEAVATSDAMVLTKKRLNEVFDVIHQIPAEVKEKISEEVNKTTRILDAWVEKMSHNIEDTCNPERVSTKVALQSVQAIPGVVRAAFNIQLEEFHNFISKEIKGMVENIKQQILCHRSPEAVLVKLQPIMVSTMRWLPANVELASCEKIINAVRTSKTKAKALQTRAIRAVPGGLRAETEQAVSSILVQIPEDWPNTVAVAGETARSKVEEAFKVVNSLGSNVNNSAVASAMMKAKLTGGICTGVNQSAHGAPHPTSAQSLNLNGLTCVVLQTETEASSDQDDTMEWTEAAEYLEHKRANHVAKRFGRQVLGAIGTQLGAQPVESRCGCAESGSVASETTAITSMTNTEGTGRSTPTAPGAGPKKPSTLLTADEQANHIVGPPVMLPGNPLDGGGAGNTPHPLAVGLPLSCPDGAAPKGLRPVLRNEVGANRPSQKWAPGAPTSVPGVTAKHCGVPSFPVGPPPPRPWSPRDCEEMTAQELEAASSADLDLNLLHSRGERRLRQQRLRQETNSEEDEQCYAEEHLPRLRTGFQGVCCLSAVPRLRHCYSDVEEHERQNVGSAGHPNTCNRPCLYHWRQGCRNGRACLFCHLPHAKRAPRLDKRQRHILETMDVAHFSSLLRPVLEEKAKHSGLRAKLAHVFDQVEAIARDMDLWGTPPSRQERLADERRMLGVLRSMSLGQLSRLFKRYSRRKLAEGGQNSWLPVEGTLDSVISEVATAVATDCEQRRAAWKSMSGAGSRRPSSCPPVIW